jgi:hypothetical protein
MDDEPSLPAFTRLITSASELDSDRIKLWFKRHIYDNW